MVIFYPKDTEPLKALHVCLPWCRDMGDYKIDQRIDITKEICPMTFVKTKLKLETMAPGQLLEVTLSGGEPLINVPRSIKDEGHKILEIIKEDKNYKLIIERR